MSKLDDAIAMLMQDHGETSNAEFAKRLGCDEGIIRRARKEAYIKTLHINLDFVMSENASLKDENASLKAELAHCRQTPSPPRGGARPEPLRLLWERDNGSGEFTPFIPMLGD